MFQNSLITIVCLVQVQTYDVNYLNMARTCLKVLKVNCSRLRKSLSLEAFASLEV
jgi:hypothetical protein